MVFITGSTGGIGKCITEKVLQTGTLCCAFVRDVSKMNGKDNQIPSNLILADYELGLFEDLKNNLLRSPEILSCQEDIVLVLSAFSILPIQMADKFTKQEITENINFNIAKQVEIVSETLKFVKKEQKLLKIVHLDSGAAYHPINGWSLYCAGKAYIDMFLRVIAQENNIPVVLYDPGVVDTKMQRVIRESSQEDFPSVCDFQGYYTQGKLHSADDIAQDILERYLLRWTAKELCESFDKNI